MKKLNWKNSVVGLGLLISFIFLFFPTKYFIAAEDGDQFTNNKQQHFNTIGQMTVSPARAAGFYYYNKNKTLWIDIRNAAEFGKEHLPIAENLSPAKVLRKKWPVEQILIIYGDNDQDAGLLVARLRNEKNIRAFMVKGGFTEVKKCLIDPLSIGLKASLSDEQLEELLIYRSDITGAQIEETRAAESDEEEEIEEGC
jgi:rhodanese-related sulfurtransferase